MAHILPRGPRKHVGNELNYDTAKEEARRMNDLIQMISNGVNEFIKENDIRIKVSYAEKLSLTLKQIEMFKDDMSNLAYYIINGNEEE